MSVQPPARQAVIYMTMWVLELSFPYLKVGGTKTNHTEASALKTDVRPLIEVSTAIQIYLPVCRTWNCFLFFSSALSWPLLFFLAACLPFFPPTPTHFTANAVSPYAYFFQLMSCTWLLKCCQTAIKVRRHQEIDVFPTANKHWSTIRNNVKNSH